MLVWGHAATSASHRAYHLSCAEDEAAENEHMPACRHLYVASPGEVPGPQQVKVQTPVLGFQAQDWQPP